LRKTETDVLNQRGVLQICTAVIFFTALVGLSGCGNTADPLAAQVVSYVSYTQGFTPFMGQFHFQGNGLKKLTGYSFTIQAKSGSVSAPVKVSYTGAALLNRGSVQSAPGQVIAMSIPVFGLYADFTNLVLTELQFSDGSSWTQTIPIETQSYTDPTGTYAKPVVVKPRAAGTTLGFDFFAMKSEMGTPVIVDTDGEIRWVGAGISDSISSIFTGDGFIIGDPKAPTIHQLSLGGALNQSPLQSPVVTAFHHNIDLGKQGFLIEVNTAANIGTIAEEIAGNGSVLNTWDLGSILSTYMQANGDDPSTFVRPGIDWFHMNAMTYDGRDDSIVVSSRENFLIKLDYKTGNIIWIFGDPTKYWYTFPSLRGKAITLQGGGLYPIGQHAVSITSDGLLMIFNDGLGSANQPAGAPAGESRTYSAVSAYSIDKNSLTAQEAWDFDYGQTIYSEICSSAYEAPGKTYLVDYAVADNLTHARLVGLDSNRNVVFDFQYPTVSCDTSWNAVPVQLDNLKILQ
jgi:arylsulfate sulfotransferase